jgi:hypothetical protein
MTTIRGPLRIKRPHPPWTASTVTDKFRDMVGRVPIDRDAPLTAHTFPDGAHGRTRPTPALLYITKLPGRGTGGSAGGLTRHELMMLPKHGQRHAKAFGAP